MIEFLIKVREKLAKHRKVTSEDLNKTVREQWGILKSAYKEGTQSRA